MGRNTWYDKWQKNRIYSLSHNLLNSNSYVFSHFPRTNQYGFQDGKARSVIEADLYARFYRMKGNNVLFPIGFHSLGASSILQGRKSGTDDDKITDMFYRQLKELGVGINEDKLIDMKDDTFIKLLQMAFIDLYNNKNIIYHNKVIFYDEKTNKIYNDSKSKKNLKRLSQKCFLLDIKDNINDIIKIISNLDIDKKYKKEMFDFLNPVEYFYIDLYLSNKTTLKIKMEEPEYLGGISYISLNPDFIDINKYVTEDEKHNVDVLLNKDSELIIYSGSYAINPLTGKEIPICISKFYKKDLYLGIPTLDDEDLAIATEYGFNMDLVLSNNVFVNSDFLDGMDKKTAHTKIIEAFTDAEIGFLKLEYDNTEINLFSLDNYGPLFPFIDNGENLVPLSNNLPFKFSSQFRLQNQSFKMDDGQALGGTINNYFIEGMAPFISIFYDKFSFFDSFLSANAKRSFEEWIPLDLMIIDDKSIISELLMPIIIFEIFKKHFKFDKKLFSKIMIESKVVDVKLNDIKRANNNLIDFDSILDKYYSDSIRYFILSNEIDKEFTFDIYRLTDLNKYVINLENTLKNINIVSSNNIEYEIKELRLDIFEKLNLYETDKYIKLIIDFTDKYIINRKEIGRSELLKYLQLISLMFPFLAEEIYELKFNSKFSIYNEGF